eukprot:UN08109
MLLMGAFNLGTMFIGTDVNVSIICILLMYKWNNNIFRRICCLCWCMQSKPTVTIKSSLSKQKMHGIERAYNMESITNKTKEIDSTATTITNDTKVELTNTNITKSVSFNLTVQSGDISVGSKSMNNAEIICNSKSEPVSMESNVNISNVIMKTQPI